MLKLDSSIFISTMAKLSADILEQALSVGEGGEENVNNLIKELTTDTNIEAKTDLNANQITAISRALWFAKRYHCTELDNFVKLALMKVLISKDRGGRKEIVQSLIGVFRYNLAQSQAERVEL